MKMRSFRYIAPQAFKSMFHNGLMTVAAILTITISLFLCTAFWLLIINIDANAKQMEEDVRVLVYLKDDITEDQYESVKEEIMAIPGVADCQFISRDDGIKDLEERFGGIDLVETLGGANPLPNQFSITAETNDDVTVIAEKVSNIAAVDVVRYGEGTVEKLFALTDTMRRVGIAVMALLALAAVVLIAMTIRLTVVARKKEVMVMKWVGATNAFIRLPFLLEGLFLGLFGSILALALVLFAYVNAGEYLANTISFVLVLDLSQIWQSTAVFTLTSGLLLGICGSLLPLTRFMDV